MSRKHRKGSIEHIGKLLTGAYVGSVFGSRLQDLLIWQNWQQAVGASIASHTRPLRIYGGQLTVVVANAAWMQQLNFMKEELLQKLNKTLGHEQVKSIIFKSGRLYGQEQSQPQAPLKLSPLTAKRKQQIAQQTEELSDIDLAAMMKGLMSAHYQRYPDGTSQS